MEIIRAENYKHMSVLAAGIICRQLLEKPNSAICCPTGSTPKGTYEQLCLKRGSIDMTWASFFNMDEYTLLNEENKNSFNYFLNQNLYEPFNLCESQINRLQYPEDASPARLLEYDERIVKKGGFDLLILGIGSDGHIAFNMPSTVFSAGTHIEKLSAKTIADNARHFSRGERVPEHAVTIGMKAVMSAKKIILLISGTSKAQAFKKLVSADVADPMFPASILHLHRDVTVIVDAAACEE